MTYKSFTAATLAFALVACSEENRTDFPETSKPNIDVRVDLSASNPIAVPELAARLAQDATSLPVWNELGEGSELSLRTFGRYDAVEAPSNESLAQARISRDFMPDEARAGMFDAINSIPEQVASGDIILQNETNIVAAMQDYGRRTDCVNKPTVLIVITDGLESSGAYGDQLPQPENGILNGCTVYMLGVTGTTAAHTEALITAWRGFFSAAGAARMEFLR